jgi:hypothetical protein
LRQARGAKAAGVGGGSRQITRRQGTSGGTAAGDNHKMADGSAPENDLQQLGGNFACIASRLIFQQH